MVREAVQPVHDTERLSLFLPLKVVNGFVTCDFILGCYCCRFCLNRRYPDWHALLERQRVYRNTLETGQAAALLMRIKAFTQGKVTLKIGHDTDMSLEEKEAQELISLLPGDQPIVFMRRGKLLPEHRAFYMKRRENLLMKVTLTPRSKYLDCSTDPYEILESFKGLKCNLFFAVGPVCHDNQEEARSILRALPRGSRLWVRDLIVKDVPRYDGPLSSLWAPAAEHLRRFAVEQGHTIVHYLNCIVRAELGLSFHKRGEFVSEPNPWQIRWCDRCKVLNTCGRTVAHRDALDRIEATLDQLGLTLAAAPRRFGHKSYRVIVNEDVNFGDECYLRETTGLKTDLVLPGRKTGTALSQDIVDRWRRHEFFPVDEVLALARDSYEIAQRDD
jgi:hypothetical protein